VTVTVNGEPQKLPEGATIASVVELLSGTEQGRGVAVALGGEVVPRGAWARTEVPNGALVEVVGAVQGG
jgi:sulfur carrier protein